MINCSVCSNTRKISYQGEELTCPVCEEAIWIWGNQNELANNESKQKDVQCDNGGDRRTVVKKVAGHHKKRS